MFESEDDRPKPKAPGLPRLLEPLSIEEMEDYLAELDAEIARVRQEIDRRGLKRGAAEALFGKAKG